jgi:hypothetical protein
VGRDKEPHSGLGVYKRVATGAPASVARMASQSVQETMRAIRAVEEREYLEGLRVLYARRV